MYSNNNLVCLAKTVLSVIAVSFICSLSVLCSVTPIEYGLDYNKPLTAGEAYGFVHEFSAGACRADGFSTADRYVHSPFCYFRNIHADKLKTDRIMLRDEFAYIISQTLDSENKHNDEETVPAFAQINNTYYIPDMQQADKRYTQSIYNLYNMGIVSGNDAYGSYEPYNPILKGDANVMLSRIVNPEHRVKKVIPGNNRAYSLDVQAILQNPELPSGCEITSLTMVLNYLGYNADKCALADNYLDKGEPGTVTLSEAFIGNPREWGPYGCFSPVIKRAAEKYLKTMQSDLEVYDTTGTSLEKLYAEIDLGNPVIIWATMSMNPSKELKLWLRGDEVISFISGEHCMVLHGYDKDRNVVLIADPLKGNVEYDAELFETRFKELYMQSVIIK